MSSAQTLRIGARLLALAGALALIGVAFAIRAWIGIPALVQWSGTALYAAMVHLLVLAAWPGMRPWHAAAAATGWCWAVELLQLTGVPAALSARSVLARLVLGVHFDPQDLLWYLAGTVPVLLLHVAWQSRARGARRGTTGA